MKKHCFDFLGDSYADIYNEAMFCEKHLVEGNYLDSIIRAGIASEKITLTICEIEDLKFISHIQIKRIETLFNEGYIGSDIKRRLNYIREIRNKAVHGYLTDLEEKANKLHFNLYVICVYFFKTYKDSNFFCDEYKGPMMEPTSKSEDVIIFDDDKNDENVTPSPLDNYPFEKINNSYLLNEISKLKDSSIEAVEDDNLSEFKEYLNIDRHIQDDFLEAVKKAIGSDSSHLIILCGSVGDGKSHLIANLKKKDPESFKQFIINFDATESDDPNKEVSNMDAIASVLKPFNDENINDSKEKIILAINLGVLNTFLDSTYAKREHNELRKIIKKYNIFDSDKVSLDIVGEDKDKVSLITFSDYNMFELNGDEKSNYVSSQYISSLFNKITQETNDNPFYEAYDRDKKANYIHPIIYNYEMLKDEEVQKTIIDYLIKVSLKYRKLISSRDLLNFISEILIPPEDLKIEDLEEIKDFMEYSLPNLLFGSPKRSELLKFCSGLDPTLHRNKSLDQFIIDLNIKDDTEKILNEYFDLNHLDFLKEYKEYLIDFKGFDNSDKEKATNTLIRLAVFYGKSSIKNNFKDKVYFKYLRYLYAYNKGSFMDYNDLYKETRDAIFNWRGNPEKKTICIDVLESFKVYRNLRLKHIDKSKQLLSDDNHLKNRFKTEIKIIFLLQSNRKEIPLIIDFSLYEYINKLKNGFKPNQTDKEDLIIFDEFINTLLLEDSERDLEVISLEGKEKFLLEDNSGFFEFYKEEQT